MADFSSPRSRRLNSPGLQKRGRAKHGDREKERCEDGLFPDEEEFAELLRLERERKWEEEAILYPIPDPFPPPYDGLAPPPGWDHIPDQDDLPEPDGDVVENFSELPQAILLTDSIMPILRAFHADGKFLVGSNSGIYWDFIQPRLRGMVSPDWLYIPGVNPSEKQGKNRKSYAIWKEKIRPLIVMEFISGNGTEELDRTPGKGKFWIYETQVKAKYYAIWHDEKGTLDCFVLRKGRYKSLLSNESGRYPIPEMGVELGLWNDTFYGFTWAWMRWFHPDGTMIPTGEELAEAEHQRAATEKRRAAAERRRAAAEKRRADEEKLRADALTRRADRLAAKLRALGIDPDEENGSA